MDISGFWAVIGNYNGHTVIAQVVLLFFILAALVLSYTHKVNWAAKFALGCANLYIGIFFFACYGEEAVQRYFALPLFLMCGVLFLYECVRNKNDVLEKPNAFQIILLLLYLCYPVVSILLGNSFPKMVTLIMPCPVISLSIAVYAGYRNKNLLLILLMTIWGLSGIKALVFSVYEDLILLVCGIYGLYLFVNGIIEYRKTQAE